MDPVTTILQNLHLIGALLLGIPLFAGLAWYVHTRTDIFGGPGEKEFKAYIQELGEQHDVVAEVEWKDGNVSYMGADYDVDGGHLELSNGLEVQLPGQSGTPVQLYGVPMIRTSAHVAAPFDTELAIAMEYEEDNAYDRVDQHGQSTDQPSQPETVNAVADGGVATVADHEYEWGGTAYSLTSLWERAPAVGVDDLEKQFELGKAYARSGRDSLKTFLLGLGSGVGGVLLIIFILWLLGQIGGGSLL